MIADVIDMTGIRILRVSTSFYGFFFLPSFFTKVFVFFVTALPFLATTLDFNFDGFSSVLDVLEFLRCFRELLDNLVFLLGGAETRQLFD